MIRRPIGAYPSIYNYHQSSDLEDYNSLIMTTQTPLFKVLVGTETLLRTHRGIRTIYHSSIMYCYRFASYSDAYPPRVII
jgi:hypothetical protein